MNHSKIIDVIVKHAPYKRYCDKLCNYRDIANDLYQEFFMFMFLKSEEELVKIYLSGYLESYCLHTIFNKSLHRGRFLGGTDANPLLNISNSFESIEIDRQDEYVDHYKIDRDFNNVMEYLNKDQTVKTEDVAVLFESIDESLKSISKRSGVPYITLKVKRTKLKEKIKQHVTI